ncbi:hypothetical protein BPORC_0962 [Bifidobacterium porcinum]|nr:hypothetical protein BPORC_0962 [Bifidobacterium porcinum]
MKESVLWRRLDRAVGTRLRARYKNKESGVAMVMALMFILVVLLTSTLLLGILLSQALPYRNNSRNAQGKVAAEAGLQAGLSFLRTAESYYETGNYDKLMPATTADPSKTSLDETYAVETATASSFATGTAKVVTLNYVPVNDTTSGTTAVSTSSSTHDQKLSYRIQIGYYDGDPNTTGKLVSDATKLSAVKYAVVVSYGYVNRYPDGRTAGTEADPVRTAAAIYKFEATPHSKTSAAFHAVSPTDSGWVVVTSTTKDANGDIETITTKGGPNEWLYKENLQYATDDPRNSICMVAATDLNGNVDSSKMPVEGSPIRMFKMYTSSGNHTVYTASEYCKPNGAYKNLNKWVYGKDDSIRLSSDTHLCVTGLSTDYNVLYGTNRNGAATLTTCGTSYTTSRKVVSGKDIGYDVNAEISDSNSLLNKNQKWAFYYGFINAGYLNFGKKNTANEKTPYFSRGPIRGSSSDYSHTLFQNLYAVKTRYADVNNASQEWDRCDADINDNQYEGDKSCFLISSKWKSYLYANGAFDLDSRTYAETLGNGGEAGWETNQIVNAGSGACMQAQYGGAINNNNTIAFQCYVNAAPLRPYCHADTVAHGDAGSTGASSVDCPVVEDSSISGDDPTNAGNYLWSSNNGSWKNDSISYTKGTDEKSGTLTYLKVQDNTSPGCLTADSASDGSAIHAIKNACSTTMAQFYRYEKVDGSGLFDYKFVLASTMPAPNNPTASANPNALCITEVDPGSYGYSKANGAYSNVMLKKCTDNTAVNRYGMPNNSSQQWNGVSSDGGASTYKETVGYASSKYVDAENWKW